MLAYTLHRLIVFRDPVAQSGLTTSGVKSYCLPCDCFFSHAPWLVTPSLPIPLGYRSSFVTDHFVKDCLVTGYEVNGGLNLVGKTGEFHNTILARGCSNVWRVQYVVVCLRRRMYTNFSNKQARRLLNYGVTAPRWKALLVLT